MDWICEGKSLYENELENLIMSGEYLKLTQNCAEGFLITPVIEVSEFIEITPSWNAETNNENSVEFLIRLKIGEDWTKYISYGICSADENNISIMEEQSNELVRVTTDKIFINHDRFADSVQIKVIFRGNQPKLKFIGFDLN